MTKCPSHLTAKQIANIIRPIMASQCSDYADVLWACHPQRIKREMLKRGAEKWHGVLMLESTAATQFINSHLAETVNGKLYFYGKSTVCTAYDTYNDVVFTEPNPHCLASENLETPEPTNLETMQPEG